MTFLAATSYNINESSAYNNTLPSGPGYIISTLPGPFLFTVNFFMFDPSKLQTANSLF
jgi:hypothetical protein